MKKKMRKISLSRETLRSLESPALNEAAGGVTLGPRCQSDNCGDTYSDCYISCTPSCEPCTFGCPL